MYQIRVALVEISASERQNATPSPVVTVCFVSVGEC